MNKSFNTKSIGNIGEVMVLTFFVKNHIPIYMQFGDNEYADYIILIDLKPIKIQVKTSTNGNSEKVSFSLSSQVSSKRKRHIYSTKEVDAFICYDLVNDKLFLFKNLGNMTQITFRYVKTKNGQSRNIKNSDDYILCVETLHELSNSLDKDKVQTTM